MTKMLENSLTSKVKESDFFCFSKSWISHFNLVPTNIYYTNGPCSVPPTLVQYVSTLFAQSWGQINPCKQLKQQDIGENITILAEVTN